MYLPVLLLIFPLGHNEGLVHVYEGDERLQRVCTYIHVRTCNNSVILGHSVHAAVHPLGSGLQRQESSKIMGDIQYVRMYV